MLDKHDKRTILPIFSNVVFVKTYHLSPGKKKKKMELFLLKLIIYHKKTKGKGEGNMRRLIKEAKHHMTISHEFTQSDT